MAQSYDSVDADFQDGEYSFHRHNFQPQKRKLDLSHKFRDAAETH